jgi:glycosidase
MGDMHFKDFTPQLDSIRKLGCNTVWFIPFYPIGIKNSAGQLGSPYSVRDYQAVNPEFGSLDEFKGMVAQAHARKLNVVIDWVANHTAWDHAWITAHPDWYTHNSAGQIISPAGTGWNDVADLNYANADMRQAMIASMKFWVTETGVDGFRCDAADMVPADFWKQAIDSLKAIPRPRKLLFLAEGALGSEIAAGFEYLYAWDFYSGLQALFKGTKTTNDLIATHLAENAGSFASGLRLRYNTNHDESAWTATPLDLFGGKTGAQAAFVLAATMGGAPLVYNGQEVATPTKTPFFSVTHLNFSANPDTKAAYRQLLQFRARVAALRRGTLVTYNHVDVVAYSRTFGSRQALVFVNVRNKAIDFPVPAALRGSGWLSLAGTKDTLASQLTLQPYMYRVWVRKI